MEYELVCLIVFLMFWLGVILGWIGDELLTFLHRRSSHDDNRKD